MTSRPRQNTLVLTPDETDTAGHEFTLPYRSDRYWHSPGNPFWRCQIRGRVTRTPNYEVVFRQFVIYDII
jgi:hypothetical protein